MSSVDEYLKKIKEAGKKVVVPRQGYVAYVSETEGNVFGVFQNDPSAK